VSIHDPAILVLVPVLGKLQPGGDGIVSAILARDAACDLLDHREMAGEAPVGALQALGTLTIRFRQLLPPCSHPAHNETTPTGTGRHQMTQDDT